MNVKKCNNNWICNLTSKCTKRIFSYTLDKDWLRLSCKWKEATCFDCAHRHTHRVHVPLVSLLHTIAWRFNLHAKLNFAERNRTPTHLTLQSERIWFRAQKIRERIQTHSLVLRGESAQCRWGGCGGAAGRMTYESRHHITVLDFKELVVGPLGPLMWAPLWSLSASGFQNNPRLAWG